MLKIIFTKNNSYKIIKLKTVTELFPNLKR